MLLMGCARAVTPLPLLFAQSAKRGTVSKSQPSELFACLNSLTANTTTYGATSGHRLSTAIQRFTHAYPLRLNF